MTAPRWVALLALAVAVTFVAIALPLIPNTPPLRGTTR